MIIWNGIVDLTQIESRMSIPVFNDDQAEFNLGLKRITTRFPVGFYLKSDGGDPNKFWSNPIQWVDGLTQKTYQDNNHHAQ
ncbi:MAG: hypothetical protein WCK35_11495 [Chloroflexota bacterium]